MLAELSLSTVPQEETSPHVVSESRSNACMHINYDACSLGCLAVHCKPSKQLIDAQDQ